MKTRYLFQTLRKYASGRQLAGCPSCGCVESTCVQRKYLLYTLRRCTYCELQFRAPVTTSEENQAFYQAEYKQGFTTALPAADTLKRLLETRFSGTDKNYDRYIEMVRGLAPSASRLFDFGCSWGYGSWQFAQAGYDVTSFEISKSRCDFARQSLQVQAFDQLPPAEPIYDVFFSAHVFEHVPSVAESFAYGMANLRRGGVFVAITPNGCESYRQHDPEGFRKLWGEVHPNYLDDRCWIHLAKNCRWLLTSSPFATEEVAKAFATSSNSRVGDFTGMEMLFVCQK